MSLLDAQGNPISPSAETMLPIMQNHIMQIINHLKSLTPVVENNKLQIQLLQKQILELAFVNEFILNKLVENKLIIFDETEYSEFRNNKVQELKQLQAETQLSKTKETLESDVNLEE